MERSSFRAVLLDFGGTLFSYRSLDGPTVRMLLQATNRLGIGADGADAVRAYRDASREAWGQYLRRPFYLHRDLFRETYKLFAEKLDATPTPEFLDWVHEEQRQVLVDHLELRPGCLETLRALREEGLHIGIVSNIDEDYLEPMMDRADLGDVVHTRTSSEEARSCKPDSRIFHYALEKAGVAAEEALFVGDSPEADVLGAHRVGMQSVLIREDRVPPPGAGAGPSAEPDHVIQELPELIPIVHEREG
jgi:HAD superfamily hydrolase (TIGR01509 family)